MVWREVQQYRALSGPIDYQLAEFGNTLYLKTGQEVYKLPDMDSSERAIHKAFISIIFG